jgi:hypothetical protein
MQRSRHTSRKSRQQLRQHAVQRRLIAGLALILVLSLLAPVLLCQAGSSTHTHADQGRCHHAAWLLTPPVLLPFVILLTRLPSLLPQRRYHQHLPLIFRPPRLSLRESAPQGFLGTANTVLGQVRQHGPTPRLLRPAFPRGLAGG